jgi:hypothetical protein
LALTNIKPSYELPADVIGSVTAARFAALYCASSFTRVVSHATIELAMRTVEAIIETNGEVRLAEIVQLQSPRRALVTILEEPPAAQDIALLSEAALAEDWSRTEEDNAWAHLQPGTLS